jgi:hypothetical protein
VGKPPGYLISGCFGQVGEFMKKGIARISIFLGCLSLAGLGAAAQEVVHALAGTVNNIDPSAKTITVITDDGSGGTFKDMTNSHVSMEFDKSLRTDTVSAGDFKKSGARVIVYYYGFGNLRTVVALRSLGQGPFTKTSGTVIKFNKGDHSISVKDASGAVEVFKLTKDSVAETGSGVTEGLKFEPEKGDQVRVTSTQAGGVADALFINAA